MQRPSKRQRGAGLPLVPAVVAGAVVLLLIGGYLMYDFGLSRAGYLRSVNADKMAALRKDAKALRKENKQLSERIAVLETAALVDREAYRQVEEELVAMQSRILQQQEDIEFYRGIVGDGDDSQLRLQDFRLVGLGERAYEVRLVLAQALRSNREVTGTIRIAVAGARNGQSLVLPYADLSGGAERLSYEFRYFQELRAVLTLPAGFEPNEIRVTLKPKGKGAKTVEESFAWRPEKG